LRRAVCCRSREPTENAAHRNLENFMKNQTQSIMRLLIVALLVGGVVVGCENYESRKAAHLDKAKALFEEGDDARARLELKNTLQIDSKNGEALYLLGRIAEREGDLSRAYKHYVRAVEFAPDIVDAKVKKAQLQVAGGDLEGADATIQTIFQQSPEHLGGLIARAALRKRRDDVAGAEADMRAVLGRDPGNAVASMLLARILIDRDELQAAEKVLRSAVDSNPEDPAPQLMLGNLYDRQDRPDAAIAVLQALVDNNPDEVGYRDRLANYLLEQQRLDAAEAVLRESLAQAPEDLRRQTNLIRFLARARGTEAAMAELDTMISGQSDATALRFVQAELQLATGNTEAAEEGYRAIIEQADGAGPSAIRARNALARLLLQAQRIDEARALIDAVLAESAGEPDALILRATLALRDRNSESAIADLRLVLNNDPEWPEVHRLLGLAHAQTEAYALSQDAFQKAVELAPDDPLAYLQLAEVRVRSGDPEGALATLEQLLQKVPDSVAGQQAISRIQLSQRDWGALGETAERIKSNRAEHPLGYYLEGLSLQQQGEHAAAITAFEQALVKRPDAAEPLIGAARSEVALGNVDAAEQRVQAVLKDKPGNALARFLLGDIYLAGGRLEEARDQFDEAVLLNPTSPRGHSRLAGVQGRLGDAQAQRATLERGIEATGRSGLLVLQLATVLEAQGEYDQAMAAYDEVLSRFPNAVVAANNLAMLLATRVGDQAALDRALELASPFADSAQPALVDTLGWVHHLRSEYDAAQPLLEKALAGLPDSPALNYHIGRNLAALGEVDEAREHLARAAAAEGSADQAEAQAALEALGAEG
jgi:tetratricopeptide (TPR) repeat protein